MKSVFFLLVLLFVSNSHAARYFILFDSAVQSQDFESYVKTAEDRIQILQKTDLVNGIQVETNNSELLNSLKERFGIQGITKEDFFKAPAKLDVKKNSNVFTYSSLKTLSASPVRTISAELQLMKVPEAWKITKGKGVRVLVVDSGIDRNHPDLKYKIEKTYNFIDESKGTDVTDEAGHGTHVAGLIVADNNIGVAPEAKILVAKVCDVQKCSTTAIIKALAWALKEKVDVINMSLGGGLGLDGRYMLDKLDAEQVPLVASAGNSGNNRVSQPAVEPSVIAVGSVELNTMKAVYSNYGPGLNVMAPGSNVYSTVPVGSGRDSKLTVDSTEISTVTFSSSAASEIQSRSLIFGGFGKVDELANLDVAGKVLILDRGGEISFLDKLKNAAQAKATAVILVNQTELPPGKAIIMEGVDIKLPMVMISDEDGEWLKQKLNASPTLNLSIIASDYTPMSGTSMSAPYVSGIVALMKAAQPKVSSFRARQIFLKTSTPVKDPNNLKLPGLVNAEKAVQEALKKGRGF